MKKRILSMLLVLAMVLGMLPVVQASATDSTGENPFADVVADAYYYEPVLWAVDNGITNGMDSTHFAPDGTCTRAQIVTFLWRANGSPKPSSSKNPFRDVPAGQWYTDAVLWAVEQGITTGTSATTFSPDAGCTRGQVATFLWRSQTMPASVNPINSFVDIDPSAYYYNAVLWAVENGITNGLSTTSFGPDATCTRGQIVTFLYRNDSVQKYINRYSYHCEDVSWTEANERAKAMGGHLVHLDSVGEMGYLMARIYEMDYESCNYILLGGRRDSDETEYHWVDTDGNQIGGSLNDASSWENALWLMGEPSLGYAGQWEDVMCMQYSDKDGRWGWNDVPDDLPATILKNDPSKLGTIVYIVEYDQHLGPIPSPEDEKVPAEIADLFGFDPDEYDTDGDGLSNYDEIYVVGTDPTAIDTDENGINDADDDADEDLLSNIQEIEFGTDPLKADTDLDGLSDYEEINEYGTDPCKEDTDGDGLNDGDELILGLDPLLQCTDGETLDSEREFVQQLNEENISAALLDEDNDAVPSLTVTQSGNINNEVFIEETASNVFSDSRAIVGEAIDISGSSFDEGSLSFTLNDADMAYVITEDAEEIFPTFLICKYNDDGETEYLETECDDGILSAEIDGSGTYFVLNVKNLFDELGLALPTISDVSTLSDPEPLMLLGVDDEENAEKDNANGSEPISLFTIEDESNSVAASADTVKVTTASSGVMAQADIVFIVDTTGSMGDEIDNVKNNISYFVDALNERGISAALALIDYEDITVDGYDSTRVHKNGSSNWFYDVDDYKTAIDNLSLGYGGDTPECVVDALETARLLDMRASAGKIFVLVTDANYKVDNRYDIPSMATEIELLKNARVNCSVVSPYSEQSTYYNLYTETNGVWANIYGDFYEELMVLADKIGSDIVGDGYWIYLDGPVPVPVRLDAMPEEGSDVDTDADGIPDIEELEGATPSGYIDLDALISVISRGAITNTDYGMVMMYKYTSSPVEEDSDHDGLKDAEETNPVDRLNNSFRGRMLGYYDIADASYTFDYLQFFNSASTYSNDLCSASLMFANTIYNDCGFSYDSGLEITDITELMEYHGFENVIDYKLANGYNSGEIFATPYNDDDISEIGIGYHEVTHNGATKTVLAVIIRGTNGTIEEWSSNFDMGDTETWNVDIHKGFYITEERIKSFVAQYVDAYLSDAEGLTYWITGHSRGAALANILAARLVDEGNSVYAYTFATPSTTIRESRSAAKYNSIFNFANTSDFVTYVPLQEWDFGPFGITYFMSIEDAGLENEWSKQTGVSNYNALSLSVITLATSRIAKSCCANWDEVHDRAGSQDIDDEQYGYISDRAMRYCDLTERTSIFGNHKGYKLYPSTAFIFQLGAEMLAGSDAEKDNVVALLPELWNSRYTGVILLFLGDAALNWSSFEDMELSDTLVGDGHAPATYYVLTQN